MNSEKAAKANKAVQKKVMETDDKAHKQIQKIKESKIGKMLPTEFEKITTDKVALASIVINVVMCIYTYALFLALYPKEQQDSFIGSKSGITVAVVYLLSFGMEMFIYWFRRSGFLLPFLLMRAISFGTTFLTIFFMRSFVFDIRFGIFIVGTNLFFGLIHTYLFGFYITHLKSGGGAGDSGAV